MSIEAMRLALEALELFVKYENPNARIQVRKPKDGGPMVTIYPKRVAYEAATALCQAIKQIEQDPIGDAQDRLIAEKAQQNDFNPDWDQVGVMVAEQQRMAIEIDNLTWRLKAVNTAAMKLASDLTCMEVDDKERLDRDRVMGRVVQWRNEWDKAMQNNPPAHGTYSKGVMAERHRVVNLLMVQHEMAKGAHNYWHVAAQLIQADVASDT